MRHIWIDDLGYWVEAKMGFIVEVTDEEIEALQEQEDSGLDTCFSGREALAFRDGKMVETTVPEYRE